MARRVASRGGGANGTTLCVRDKRKAQAAAAAAAAAAAVATGTATTANSTTGAESGRAHSQNGGAGGCCGFSNGHDEAEVAGGASDHRPAYALSCAHSASAGQPPAPVTLCPEPVVIERSEVIRLASQYTSCAGCSAAVKGLLQRPIEELRLVNAVVEESAAVAGCSGETGGRGWGGRIRGGGDGRHKSNGSAVGGPHFGRSGERSCGQDYFCCDPRASSTEAYDHHACAPGSQVSSSSSATFPRALQLREAYLADGERLDQLLDTFPLEALMKKVQPKGMGLRCEIHRRNGGQATADGWEWEDAWDRLPADMRLRVAAVDVNVLEAAMHQATSTHRFCADCKHNVVTAFDILTCKCDLGDIDNGDEFVPDLFWPFAGRVGPDASDHTGQKIILSCPLEDVEELICWHEHFDSREYTRNSQRHAATLEHGQREIRSIVGSVLLSQLRTNYHNHLAQVQGEQYLFALVLHAIRTRLEGSGRRLCHGLGRTNGSRGAAWAAGMGGGRPGCPGCGLAADPCCSMCEGTGVSLSELGFIEDDDKKGKTKSKKKRERKARAKAAKRIQDEAAGAAADELVTVGIKCNGHSANNHASGEEASRHTNRTAKVNGSRQKHKNGDSSGRRAGEGVGRKARQASTACQRAGSSCMMSAGSLLSMLEGTNGCGGRNGPADNDDEGDEGIDEDLVREMERLRIQKARADVQRSRAALRSNLQKNFDQLLVSSTSRDSGSKA